MKVTSYAVARPAFYDRNAVAAVISFRDIPVIATYTVRCTRTIASGEKGYLEGCTVFIARTVAATTVGSCEAFFRLTSGAATMSMAMAQKQSNTLITYSIATLGIPLTLYAGEVLDGLTSDDSVGGAVYFDVAAKFTLFVA